MQTKNEIPQSLEAETGTLGSILIDTKAFPLVRGILEPDDFYEAKHEKIFQMMVELNEKESKIDMLTVGQKLKDKKLLEKIGGRAYLMQLTEETPTSSHAEAYAKIIKEKSLARKIIKGGSELFQVGFDGSVADAEAKMLDTLQRLNENKNETDGRKIKDILKELETAESEGTLRGVNTGIGELDRITVGLKAGHFWIIGGEYKSGKCHAKGTKILMSNGTLKNVEEIMAGDTVMGVDSRSRTVKATGRGRGKLYKITPKHSESFVVNGEHILSLSKISRIYKNSPPKKNSKRKRVITNISVENYLKQSNHFKRYHPLYSVGVDFKKGKKLEVEPYFLGLWLGDGSKNASEITNMDIEVKDYLEGYAEKLGLFLSERKYEDRCPTYRIGNIGSNVAHQKRSSLQKTLREAGLLNNKHIPFSFKTASKKDRLMLLAGLIDSDGSATKDTGDRFGKNQKNVGFEFSNINERIIDDVVFLARSLGFRAKKVSRISECKAWDYKCRSFRVAISGNCWEIPVKIKRKVVKKHRVKRCREIQSFRVEPCGVGDYYGFELDGDHLYLIENFTVHHNTRLALELARRAARAHRVLFYTLEMNDDEVVSILLQQERRNKTKKEAVDAVAALDENLIIYDDKYRLAQLEAHILSQEKTPTVVFIDHIGLITTDDKEPHVRLSRVSRSLKLLAKRTGTCIVSLSQISEESIKRKAGSFKGSGDIAADCDVGMVVIKDNESELDEVRFVIDVRFNRHGRRKKIDLFFDNTRGVIMFNEDLAEQQAVSLALPDENLEDLLPILQ